ncbi:MAG: metalloregulator ArsR/SmtB family transcription factor [Polaromonas sp.]|jgi:DNA-binding transcriptional ArsR family regulator|nr:metalloregulator ArsR/SmtB family transcription factor [Polaromonas sp.]
MNDMIQAGAQSAQGRVFELAAELFAVLATPMRLRVLSALCEREKSVNELLAEIDTTQPNLSQHLAVLYRCGVLAKRKEGTQVIYRVQSEKAVALCRSVCTQIAIELDEPEGVPAAESLLPAPPLRRQQMTSKTQKDSTC